MARIIVVGAGINGVTAAIELKQRGHEVVLADPGPLPHPLAASTDISKAVRAAYGPDEDYTELAERCIPIWRKWNEQLGVPLYHETGVVYDGLQAIRMTVEFRPDIVLLDVGMPGLDGYEVARRLRVLKRERPLRIVAITVLANSNGATLH